MTDNDISYKIIGAAIELHRNVGPGLLESAYENPLAFDLRELGLEVIRLKLALLINLQHQECSRMESTESLIIYSLRNHKFCFAYFA